ncbi:hypothetical protein EIP86_004569 [Pleurotus ostreatoroseus]|nr:hypothetical protein EIP86_004569 [Pleurotus ostreatoroseus]
MERDLAIGLTSVNYDFTIVATLKLSGLRKVLSHDAIVVDQVTRIPTPSFSPTLVVHVIVENSKAETDGRAQNTLGIWVTPVNDPFNRPQPLQVQITLVSYAEDKTYASFCETVTFDPFEGHVWPTLLYPRDWQQHASMRRDDGILLKFGARAPPRPSPISIPVSTILHKMMHGTHRPDIGFTVFGRRTAGGQLYKRRVLLADGKALERSCDAMKKLLLSDGSDRYWNGVRIGRPPVDDPGATYNCPDSDFEEDDPDAAEDKDPNRESASSNTTIETSQDGNLGPRPMPDKRARTEQQTEDNARRGPNTGSVAGSRQSVGVKTKRGREEESVDITSETVRATGSEELQKQLTNDNILPEIFSRFTSLHKGVKSMEMKYLVQHWADLRDSEAFKTVLEEVAKGTYPHAGGLLAEIFQAVGSFVPGNRPYVLFDADARREGRP